MRCVLSWVRVAQVWDNREKVMACSYRYAQDCAEFSDMPRVYRLRPMARRSYKIPRQERSLQFDAVETVL